ALAFQALQVANRMELMPRLVEAAALSQTGRDGHDLVLCRYWQSAWVYGQLDGLPAEFLERVHSAMVQPDVNVLLDASPETCMARRERRDGAGKAERYEGRLDRTRKIVELYRALWHREAPFKRSGRWVVIEAEQPIEGVIRDVLTAIGRRGAAHEVSHGEGR
ncbi:MAG TPA: hypothetical protein VLI71_00245, partial [Gammaproteobacteria bacterium]|nr:hypothetical protein [Gammaproteobacteria bacterium]